MTSNTNTNIIWRSPILSVLGHVNAGKTKLLEKLRLHEKKEAGNITQQIGATFFPKEYIEKITKTSNKVLIPGILFIDTPGHEHFFSLRDRGSKLCDIAIVVVDVFNGLQQQTIEVIELLRKNKTPFIVAVNKIDKIYEWQYYSDRVRESLTKQTKSVKVLFKNYIQKIVTDFAVNCINTVLYWDNKDTKSFVSIVPISAQTSEGIPDLLMLVASLAQQRMTKTLCYKEKTECIVLEVTPTKGFSTTLDVILVNGTLQKGDTIIITGKNEPVITKIRHILLPKSTTEDQFSECEKVTAAIGVKIVAKDLDQCLPGNLLLYDSNKLDEQTKFVQNIELTTKNHKDGIHIQSNTIGGLEALEYLLIKNNIPIASKGFGTITNTDVTKAHSVILGFNVDITDEASITAQKDNKFIILSDLVHEVVSLYQKHKHKQALEKLKSVQNEIVYPVILKILPTSIFRKRNPIIVGVKVVSGILKIGTPLCVIKNNIPLKIGQIESIQHNNTNIFEANIGQEICIKITSELTYDRHFNFNDNLYSYLTRESIDSLKINGKDFMTTEQWKIVIKLKKMLSIN